MQPIGRCKPNFDPQRQPDHDEPDQHDHEHRWPVARVLPLKVKAADRAPVRDLEIGTIELAPAASRAAAAQGRRDG